MKFCFYGNIANALNGNPAGGGEQQIALISKYINKLGHEVIVLDFNINSDKIIDGIKLISVKNYNKKKNFYLKVFSILKKIKADVYYGRVRGSIHLLPLIVSHRQKSLYVHHLASDLDSLSFYERWEGFYSKVNFIKKIKHFFHSEIVFPYILKKADIVFVQNDQQYSNLEKSGIKTIYEINNLFVYNKIYYDLSITKQNKKLSNYFLYIGSLDLRKGINELNEIIINNPDRNFMIIGKIRDEKSKKTIQKLTFYKNVKYLGHLSHEEVLYYLKNAKALINTSVYEGFSNVFLESWSLGIPVLSLFSNPSNVIDKFDLGKCYKGNLSKMIHEVRDFSELVYNRERIIKYVKMYHDPILNAELIIKCIKSILNV